MLALPLLALLLAAPPPDQSRAEALLASTRPIDRAWGTFLAGRLSLTPLIPKLTAELDRLRPIPTSLDRENWSLAHILFDALIELKAPLTFDQLKPWLNDYRDEALILLLQYAPLNLSALLELRPNLNGPHWLAVTNRLVQQRAPGIAAALLGETKLGHILAVYDSEPTGTGGGFGSYFSPRGTTQFAKGFPPGARYQIVIYPITGDTLLAPGPRTVYQRRIVVPTDAQIEWVDSSHSVDTQWEIIAHFAAILGHPKEQMRRIFKTGTAIQWTTPAAFVEAAFQSLQVQSNEIRQLTAQLTQSELLTSLELSTLRLRILPNTEDNRRNRSGPIPTIAPFPVDLTAP